MSNLANIAINLALSNDWEKAISCNKEILIENPTDVNALNRLAFAYWQMHKLEEAKKIYRKLLTIDSYNIIAKKNLAKLNNLPRSIKSSKTCINKISSISPSLFIEEPGRTKTVALTHLAPSTTLSNLNIGDPVFLNPKKHSIEVRSEDKTYLGALPDDIAFRLLRFIKAGNLYDVYIKNITKNSLSVFIHEIKRGKRFASQPSFVTSTVFRGLSQEETKQEDDDISPVEKKSYDGEDV